MPHSRGKAWHPYEIAILKKEYPKRTAREVSQFVGHSEASVRRLAHNLGIKKDPDIDAWKPWMIDILRENYAKTKNDTLMEWIGVGRHALTQKAKALGLKKEGGLYRPSRTGTDGRRRDITPEEDAFIRQNIGILSQAAIARQLGYARCTISSYCRRKGIKK